MSVWCVTSVEDLFTKYEYKIIAGKCFLVAKHKPKILKYQDKDWLKVERWKEEPFDISIEEVMSLLTNNHYVR